MYCHLLFVLETKAVICGMFLSAVGLKIPRMQPADSASYTAYMIVYGEIDTAYLDAADSWIELKSHESCRSTN